AAAALDGEVAGDIVDAWLRDCAEVQEPITNASRLDLVGRTVQVLVDGDDDLTGAPTGRTFREAPEIDGVVRLDGDGKWCDLVTAVVTDVEGPDLDAQVVRS